MLCMSNAPRKSLGQHWLYDEATLRAICDSVDVGRDDVVLEIGPGLGTLTKELVQRAKQVIAVEFDQELADQLPSTINDDLLMVIHEDILQFDLTGLPPDYKVVANIPYYLTSNLIRVLCESTNPFSEAAILIQKEVAERVVAGPGKMSLLSVSAQFYCEVRLGIEVPAQLFTPPPKVDSQVLVLKFRPQSWANSLDTKLFFRIVRAGFSQKRKTLQNALSGGLQITKEEAKALLDTAGIPAGQRAQALSLEEWHALYQAVAS